MTDSRVLLPPSKQNAHVAQDRPVAHDAAHRRIVTTEIATHEINTQASLELAKNNALEAATINYRQSLWLAVQLNPLLHVELGALHCCVRFTRPLDALSSAVLHGGKTRASAWLNLRVIADAKEASAFPCPENTLLSYGNAIDLNPAIVGMMTAASMQSCRIRYFKRDSIFVCCVATSGITNARRTGDPADDDTWQTCQRPVGTINIAVFTNANLSDASKVEALQLIAEAKTAACHDSNLASPISGMIATGTGTDASAIFCDPEGMPIDYCGKHVIMGEAIGSLVYDVVKEGIAACRLNPK